MLHLNALPSLEKAAHWSLDLLAHLDWHAFQELVGRLLHRAGFSPEVAWIRLDGGTALTLIHPTRPGRLEAVVQCAPWFPQEIDAASLQALYEVVIDEGAQRGIFVTPGVFRKEARAFAFQKPLELVDGSDLLGTLNRLSEEERSYFLRMATMGPYMIPSCPSCTVKMRLIDDSAAALGQRRPDVLYKDRRFESDEIDCGTLTLKKAAEVTFMKSVTADFMTVHGRATGNIVVNGRLHIAAGGCVSGLISARSIQLDPGGSLEAEARILNATELAHLRIVPVHQNWHCANYPKCRVTLPLR